MARSRRGWAAAEHAALLPLLLVLVLGGLGACGGSQTPQNSNFGPLAVIESVGAAAASAGTGPIHITDRCVTLTTEQGDVLLPVWRSPAVRWDEDNRAILLSNEGRPGAEPTVLRDGDIITLGGAYLDSDAAVQQNLNWLATPDPSCSGKQWTVGGVIVEKQ